MEPLFLPMKAVWTTIQHGCVMVLSYRDCFCLISTLLQDLVDPWWAHTHRHTQADGGSQRRKMIHKQTPSGSHDDFIELQSDISY